MDPFLIWIDMLIMDWYVDINDLMDPYEFPLTIINPSSLIINTPSTINHNQPHKSIHSQCGFHAASGELAQPIVSWMGAPCAGRGTRADFHRGGGTAAGVGRGKRCAG